MGDNSMLLATVYWVYIACLAYYVVVNVYYLILFVFAASENKLRVQQQRHEDLPALSRSRHTIPVSVIVPGYNEEQTVSDCLYSLAKLDYPQYEVIMVNDGSTDRTMEVLIEEFDLVQVDVFSRRHFETADVRGVYRSTIYKEFYVIDKVNGGKADSLNAGINFSRYPYVCTCDADTIFAPDSLLKAMRVVLRDPERVVAVGSLIGINNGFEIEEGSIKRFGLPRETVVALQLIEYLRSFLLNRLAWTRMNFMMVVSGAFAIYRRDVLIELEGFSREFTCEDIEMTFRVHEHMRRNKRPYRILSLPEAVSWTEAPHTWRNLYRQRHRWQRVICETFWSYRRMFLNPRYGTVGTIGMPYYLLGEVLPWIPELASLVIISLAIYLAVFSWWPLLIFLGIFILTNVLLSVMGVLLQDTGFRTFSLREICRLVLLSFVESFGYRQLLSWSRFAGTIAFFRGDQGWQKFSRVERRDLTEQTLSPDLAPETPRRASPALADTTRHSKEEKHVERPPADRSTDPTPEKRRSVGNEEGDGYVKDPLRTDSQVSGTGEGPGSSEPRLPKGPARLLRRSLTRKADSEERSETRRGEVAAQLDPRHTKSGGEDEDVSDLVRDLDEYVERIDLLRDNLAEGARRISELRDKLEQDTSEIDALRSRIGEELSRIDELIRTPPASVDREPPSYPGRSS